MKKLPFTALFHNCASDPEDILPHSMTSVWFCDQKLFISDNSTPKALELAKRFGFEIHEYEGVDSMSARRNWGLQFANHDILLQCDSDEVYDWDAHHVLRAFYEKGEMDELNDYAVMLYNLDRESGNLMSTTPLERIFRKGVKWDKLVQNKLIVEGDAKFIPIGLNHYGYERANHTWKQWNRIKLNEDEVRKDPTDMHARMYLVNALTVAGAGSPLVFERINAHVQIIADQYNECPKELGHKKILQKTMRFFFCACMAIGRFENLVDMVTPYMEDIDFVPDPNYWMYFCNANLKRYETAYFYGMKFIETLDGFNSVKENVEVTTQDRRGEVLEGLKHLLDKREYVTKEEKKWRYKQKKMLEKL